MWEGLLEAHKFLLSALESSFHNCHLHSKIQWTSELFLLMLARGNGMRWALINTWLALKLTVMQQFQRPRAKQVMVNTGESSGEVCNTFGQLSGTWLGHKCEPDPLSPQTGGNFCLDHTSKWCEVL